MSGDTIKDNFPCGFNNVQHINIMIVSIYMFIYTFLYTQHSTLYCMVLTNNTQSPENGSDFARVKKIMYNTSVFMTHKPNPNHCLTRRR